MRLHKKKPSKQIAIQCGFMKNQIPILLGCSSTTTVSIAPYSHLNSEKLVIIITLYNRARDL